MRVLERIPERLSYQSVKRVNTHQHPISIVDLFSFIGQYSFPRPISPINRVRGQLSQRSHQSRPSRIDRRIHFHIGKHSRTSRFESHLRGCRKSRLRSGRPHWPEGRSRDAGKGCDWLERRDDSADFESPRTQHSRLTKLFTQRYKQEI